MTPLRMEPRTYSTEEAAALSGYSKRTIQTWVKRGKIPAIQLSEGGKVRIIREPFDAWLRAGGKETPWPEAASPNA